MQWLNSINWEMKHPQLVTATRHPRLQPAAAVLCERAEELVKAGMANIAARRRSAIAVLRLKSGLSPESSAKVTVRQ